MDLSIRDGENSELLRSSVYFSAVCLIFYLYAPAMFDLAARFYNGDGLTAAYAVSMLGNACGYLSYSCLVRRGVGQRRIVLCSVVSILVTIAAMFFIKSFVLFLVVVFITAASNGLLGALAHWSLAMLADGSPISGRAVGCAYAAALTLQYVIVHVCGSNQPAAQAAGLIITGAAALVTAPPRSWLTRPENPARQPIHVAPERAEYTVTIACVAALALAYGLYDGVSSNLHAHNELSVWSFPRLFSVAGMLAAAWIADCRDRTYLSAAALCFLTADTAAVLFLRSPATYALSQSLQYLFSGMYVFFFTIVFMDIAPRSKEPALWAGMGRAVYSAALVPLLFIGKTLFSRFGELPIISLTIAVFAVAIILLVARDRIVASAREKRAKIQRPAMFQARYSLSDREMAVAKLLMEDEDTIEAIASAIGISKRTCQRDITAIYEKTNTQTRAGLLRAFHEE